VCLMGSVSGDVSRLKDLRDFDGALVRAAHHQEPAAREDALASGMQGRMDPDFSLRGTSHTTS